MKAKPKKPRGTGRPFKPGPEHPRYRISERTAAAVMGAKLDANLLSLLNAPSFENNRLNGECGLAGSLGVINYDGSISCSDEPKNSRDCSDWALPNDPISHHDTIRRLLEHYGPERLRELFVQKYGRYSLKLLLLADPEDLQVDLQKYGYDAQSDGA